MESAPGGVCAWPKLDQRSAIGDRETMVELRGYGFAPVATVLSFVADNCEGKKNRAAISCRYWSHHIFESR
jgi:hypothetical protein